MIITIIATINTINIAVFWKEGYYYLSVHIHNNHNGIAEVIS